MFAFVCPIRHPKTSNDYNEVIKLLELTITSVCAQKTPEDFIFVVVCNEIPEINISQQNQAKVVFVPVDFDPPDNNKGTEVTLDAVKFDKGTKIARGLIYLKAYQPDYVYVIDGDDWINVNVLALISHKDKNQNIDLWYSNSGYIVNYKNQTYIKKYGVCRYCGSTFIYKYKTLMTLTGLANIAEERPTQPQITAQIDEHILKNILGNHRHQLPFYHQNDLRVKQIPIPAVSWILNTGENHTGKNGGVFGFALTQSFLNDFGIPEVNLTPQKISIKSMILTQFDSLKSWCGWIFANKNADKV